MPTVSRPRGPSLAATALAFVTAAALAAPGTSAAAPPDLERVLPPLAPWTFESLELVLPSDHPWATPFEASGLVDSPSYDDTVAWIERLCEAAPELELTSIGESPEGRSIAMVVASAEGARTPEALARNGRATVLVQAGIHSGEIDGKDAGMMLLRDMTVVGSKRDLLDRVNVLFIPILNVDGHERGSRHGRINQRGPRVQGWRTNARNLNLNRDYAKLDTPELRALVAAIERFAPDLYVDVHVTDGVDWQYDVTWGHNRTGTWSPSIAAWIDRVLDPPVTEALERAGHVPGELVFPIRWPLDPDDPKSGVVLWSASPRLSNGYGDARHLPTILVENHALKPFDRRVLGTYVFLESLLRTTGAEVEGLRRAVRDDVARDPERLSLGWRLADAPAPEPFRLLGIEQELRRSAISGDLRVVWTGRPFERDVPAWPMSKPTATLAPPVAWWIPAAWGDVIDRLERHGIRVERIERPTEVEIEAIRVRDADLADAPYEGRVRVSASFETERRAEVYAPGSARVPFDQPLGVLAALLLEPESPDSFFQWGFFLEALQRTEYFESYVMEAMAEAMLEDDPALADAFDLTLSTDLELLRDPRARLMWFYRKTPYFDERFELYPVGRERDVPP